MNLKFIKISIFIFYFISLTAFMPIFSYIGPAITILSSGNIYKAGAQFSIERSIKDKTGLNTFKYIENKFKKDKNNEVLNEKIRRLVEKRILNTRKELNLKNFNQ